MPFPGILSAIVAGAAGLAIGFAWGVRRERRRVRDLIPPATFAAGLRRADESRRRDLLSRAFEDLDTEGF